VIVAPISANPLPPGVVLCHVHPWDQYFCNQNPISDCNDINQYSEAVGDVEFDLYYIGMAEQIESISLEIGWPSNWTFVDFENCSEGFPLWDAYPDHCNLEWYFVPPVEWVPGEPFLLGRLRLDVGGFGSLIWINGWCEGEPMGHDVWLGPAMAGVGDCFCYTNCAGLGLACGMAMDPEILEIDVDIGETAEGLLSGPVRFGNFGEVCPVEFVCDEPWVMLTVEWPEVYWADITVTVDATDLPLGHHTAVVRAESECVDCSEVIVHVREPSGIGDDEPALYETVSVGKIKNLYR
jgi:hypothetical protein